MPDEYQIETVMLGASGATVERLTTGDLRVLYRKTSAPGAPTSREPDILLALSHDPSARATGWIPELIARSPASFVQSEVPGVPLSTVIRDADGPGKVGIATAFGRALRVVHSLSPTLDLAPGSWEKILADARELDPSLSPIPGDAPVFSHGDWCLPNVLMDSTGVVTGVVDWGDAGYLERRIDLGTGLWTLRYNLVALGAGATSHDECARAFLAGYGDDAPPETLAAFVKLYG